MGLILKLLLAAGIIAYVISPIDLVPGPIDDVIVALCGVVAAKKWLVKKDK